MELVDRVKGYFSGNGILSKNMPGFEYRPQQVEMAEAVARSLAYGEHLIVEAGTGTGKSLSYLVPSILWALENNKKIVISTYTKTLQQQILLNDIPLIRQKLGLDFRYSLCMGHENYLSLRRLKRASQAGMFTRPGYETQLQQIFDWAGTTPSGLKNDLSFEPMAEVWEDVGRQKDLCMGKNCESYNACFYFKERRKWFSSQLLIVNHHLFFANVANRGAVLPRFDAVVFDEAQNLEEAATTVLGLEISNSGLIYHLDRLFHPRTRRGILGRIQHESVGEVLKLVQNARAAVGTFFDKIFEDYGREDRVLRFYNPVLMDNNIYVPMKDLHEGLKTLEGVLGSEEDRLEVSAAANRCFEFNNTLSAFLNQNFDRYVYWLEIVQRKRFPRAVLRGVPIQVAEELNQQVFAQIDRMVLTSATLTTQSNFEFIKERIGYQPNREKVLDSPFDHRAQVLLYVPRDLPEPGDEVERYVEGVACRARELIQITEGKTFILFTSYAVMNRVYVKLEFMRKDYQLLKQGDIPPRQMIQRFKETPSVIFGTSSFWQGVDIPGEALKSVIITKLPFDVPSEPLTEARLEDLKKKSINPFVHYQIPRAIIQLRQGFGRLIRKKTDTGVVSILDTRLVSRGYGKQFIDSLPSCRVVDEMEEVKDFISNGARVESGL